MRVDASGLGPFSVREVVGGGRPFVCRGRFSWPVDAGEFAIFEISPEGR